jgi:hypothetical protein
MAARLNMAKHSVKAKLPRVVELDDGRIVVDVEAGLSIVFARDDDDLCRIEILLSRGNPANGEPLRMALWGVSVSPCRAWRNDA